MNRFITFIVIFTIWLIWSGLYDSFHISLGIISSLIVVFWTGDLFVQEKRSFGQRLIELINFELYSIWLLWQIVLANVQVFKLSFHPNLLDELKPRLVKFKTVLKGDISKFILAQSITLTPGTITVSVDDSEFTVHAITDDAAKGLPGDMEKKVARVFSRKSA